MNRLMLALLVLFVAIPAFAQEVTEPKTGTKFAAKDGDMSLLGVGLRTKTVLKVKVYAIGLYVADSAISGLLKGKAGSPDLYRELVNGDFKKKVIMKFVRDVSANQIRVAFRETLGGAGPKTEIWLQYFGDLSSGQELVIGWTPGVGLETKVAGVNKPPINDEAFASAVFAIWLGDKPVQDDMKKDMVARAGEVLKCERSGAHSHLPRLSVVIPSHRGHAVSAYDDAAIKVKKECCAVFGGETRALFLYCSWFRAADNGFGL